MIIRRTLPLLFAILLLGSLGGCTSGGSIAPVIPPAKPISVLFLGAPPSSLAIYASATFSAGIANGTSTTSNVLTWSITCSSPGACGSLSTTTALGGSPVTYTAPSAIPAGSTVTITATAVADTTKSISATVTIVPPIPISVSFFATVPASTEVGASIPLSAAILNDVSANPKVQWSVTCGASTCGSFNPIDTTSEAQTTFAAPSAIPLGGTVTITATSITDPTKSASASIIITAAGPALANGTYVFQLSGPSGYNASFTTGVFTAQNGAITGGEQDSTYYLSDADGNSNAYTQFQQLSGGSYTTTAAGNLQINLTIGQGETETLTGALTSGSQGFVAQLYGTLGSGSLALQTAVAPPAGGYAFSTFGGDRNSQSASLGGVLNIDSPGKISGAGSVIDVNDDINTSGEEALGASTVSAPDKFGRVQIQLLPGSKSILPSLYLAGYIVDATHIFLTETGGDNFLGVQGGQALGQGASTGTFTTSSLANSSYVFAISQTGLQVAGVFTAGANGSLTGTLNRNNLTGTGAQSPIPFTGSYTVDPTGRVTLSNLTDGSTFNYSLHLYLSGSGNGLLADNGTSTQLIGQAFQQQTVPFTAASFSGGYGMNASQTTSSYVATPLLATVTSTPTSTTDTLAGYAVTNNRVADFAFTGNLTAAANGVFTGTLTGLNTKSPATANAFTFYLIDSTRAVAIETDTTQLTLGYMAHQ